MRRRRNIAAFIWALVTVPLVVFLSFAALAMATGAVGLVEVSVTMMFPMVAAVISLPTYLTFGTVAFLRALERPAPRLSRFALNGFLAHLASMPTVLVVLLIGFQESGFGLTLGFLGLGAVCAPLWSILFGILYRYFSTSIPQTPA